MSLRPDDRASRSRSKSPGRSRDRSRSRSNVRVPEAPQPPSAVEYPRAPEDGDVYGNGMAAERPSYFRQASYPPPAGGVPYPQDDDAGGFPSMPAHPEDDLAYGDPLPSPRPVSRHATFPEGPYGPQSAQIPTWPADPSPPSAPYQYRTEPVTSGSRSNSYQYKYADPPENITYTARPQGVTRSASYTATPRDDAPQQLPRNYPSKTYEKDARFVEMKPESESRDGKASKSKKTARLSLDTRDAGGLGSRMDRLSVSGDRPDVAGIGNLPPPSPMLEAYHGTYQQLSPMPLALRPKDEDDLSDLELSAPAASRSVGFANESTERSSRNDKLAQDAAKKKVKKSVSVYDEDGDATKISEALTRHRGPDTKVICDLLPFLSHDNIVYLKKSYKKQVKVSGKGVNLAKHLKTKLDGHLSKIAYVTALGRWESEGYWANFWYQSHNSRRELLIESLMGRTNAEIWNIKDEFKDKKYADDLVGCMERELKPDKFRTTVLMVLEERRQEEQDPYPPEYRSRDVEMLYQAISAPKGGESTMLEIVVRRSDSHLREVLKMYEKMYGENLARAALKKSSNLVVSLTCLSNRPPHPREGMSTDHLPPPSPRAKSSPTSSTA